MEEQQQQEGGKVVPKEATRQKKKGKRKTKAEKECFHCGAVGHLAKACPKILKEKEEGNQEEDTVDVRLIYQPPKRIRFKSEADLTAFKDRIVAFKYQSRKKVLCCV